VYRDLRPYVCTFAECSTPDKLYATRSDWLYHEMQIHRRQWTCRQCNEPYESIDDMVSHLEQVHAGSWTKHQLPVLLEMSEGPLDETKQRTCPICLYEDFLNRVLEHMARHMEEIALFALPKETPADGDGDSHKAGGLKSLDSRADNLSSVYVRSILLFIWKLQHSKLMITVGG